MKNFKQIYHAVTLVLLTAVLTGLSQMVVSMQTTGIFEANLHTVLISLATSISIAGVYLLKVLSTGQAFPDSPIWSINFKDFLHGLIISLGTGVTTALIQVLNSFQKTGVFDINKHTLLIMFISIFGSGIAYVLNIFKTDGLVPDISQITSPYGTKVTDAPEAKTDGLVPDISQITSPYGTKVTDAPQAKKDETAQTN